MDVLTLSRLQFALTIMFHYLFPPLSIGLGALLVFMEGMFLKTKDPAYESMARFWTKIFGVNFALGVATGVVMEFQFGTNWASFSRFVGDVFGSALAAEGIFAFFLESGFLALLVFGWDRVGPKMHFFSTLMVFLGSVFSAVWIVIANSWQQTPAGHRIVGEGASARAEIVDFWAMVFNPSSMDRLTHVLIGAFIMGAFFVMSVTAYYILKRRHVEIAKKCFVVALVWGALVSWGQLLSGHRQARIIAEHQPAKLAAFEGHFKTGTGGTSMFILGHPDKQAEITRGLAVPRLLSLLIYGDSHRPVPGLDQVAPEDRPPVALSFHSYHLMVAIGFFLMGLTALGLLFWWRKKLFDTRWLLWIFVFAVLGPVGANQLGWVAAEVGRQPWLVYGLLRTSQGLSAAVRAPQVLGSIIMFSMIYVMLGSVWWYVVDKKIRQGPEPASPRPRPRGLLQSLTGRADPSGPSMTDAEGKG